MFHPENNENSNFYRKETAPGSGQYYICIKDVTKCYRGLTYGFYLEIPDDFPEHILDVVKPHLTYADFDYGKIFAIKAAIGTAPWMALTLADKKFLAQCELTKVGTAHIQLRYRDTQA